MQKRFYIIFVSRDDDGRLRKIPVPLHYAYVFVAAAVVGLFTITGMAGSYSRMLVKTARFNQVRTDQETLRKDYLQMEQVAHDKDVQAASLGSLAGEVSALYGLGSKHLKGSTTESTLSATGTANGLSDQQYHQSLDQLVELRTTAMSGQIARTFDFSSRSPLVAMDMADMSNAPSLWPVQGRVTSSFGEREDPFHDGEGAFHTGIDIATVTGDAIRATADGVVTKAEMGNGYGREIVIDHGHGIETLYAHLSGFAVTAGQDVRRGDVIGFVGSSGHSTGPHLHYEVRIRNIPVNPHPYLRESMNQFASASTPAMTAAAPAALPRPSTSALATATSLTASR